jgi:predicted DNA-binding transcriptional regulator AlpA
VRLGISDLCRREETTRSVASPGRLGISSRTLSRWVADGTFPAPHYLGTQRKWWLAEVAAWEAEHTSRPEALDARTARLRGHDAAGVSP